MVKYLILGLCLAMLLAGCVQQDTGGQTQLPNPASVNCVDKGYTLEIRTDDTGGQYGVCKYAGNECEEWALYRHECCFQAGDCTCTEGTPKCENQQCKCDTGEQPPAGLPNPAAVNCDDKGYGYEIRSGAAGEYGVCEYQGMECEEWALYRQECCLQASDCTCTEGTPKCENQGCGCVTEPTSALNAITRM